MKNKLLLIAVSFALCSCSIPKVNKVHIINENKCYEAKTSIYYSGLYIYVNGNRYRRNNVLVITENEKCPYCDK